MLPALPSSTGLDLIQNLLLKSNPPSLSQAPLQRNSTSLFTLQINLTQTPYWFLMEAVWIRLHTKPALVLHVGYLPFSHTHGIRSI